MLSSADSERLTKVGAGTPMGELLRRYWHPIAAASEFDTPGVKAVRLMGEDLVLYKDHGGKFGLLDRHCAHRRADLAYGFVEECGLRCSYHGWRYDHSGACTAQPYEDAVNPASRLRRPVGISAYPVLEKAGLLFAYLGPDPAPLCPNWEIFEYENGFRQIVFAEVHCNWLQCVENDLDPVHFEWLHGNWSLAQQGRYESRAPRHLSIVVEEWEYGFAYRRILETTSEGDEAWIHPRLHLMPNIFLPSGSHLEYRVPIDDERTLSVVWVYEPVPLEARPFTQPGVPHWYAPVTDSKTGSVITTHVINQDIAAWVGQGRTVDRSREHLGKSDIGVVKLRRQFLRDIDALACGQDPKGVVRDEEANGAIMWPDETPRRLKVTRGLTRAEWRARRSQDPDMALLDPKDHFKFHAGQPEEVRRAYEAAMGIAPG